MRARPYLLLLLLAPARLPAAEDPFGAWAPANGAPVTAAVAARVPVDGAACIEDAVKRARRDVSYEIDQLTTGAQMELDRYKEPFALCMVEKGWHRVDPSELAWQRVLGEVEDCRAGVQKSCAGAVNQYVHGIPGSPLEAKTGMEIARELCDKGDTTTCLTAASVILRPPPDRGLVSDPRAAVGFAATGCDKGDAECCGFAGVLLSSGAAGLTIDTSRGGRYLARACTGGVSSACNWPNGGTDTPADAQLPTGAHWCRYASPTVDGPGCGAAPVTWMGVPSTAACAPKVSVKVGNCTYDYRLGK